MSPEELEKARAAINSLLAEGWDNDAATVRELVAEIERLRAIIDKPLEEKAWKMDCDILNASSDDAEIYLARRWHAAYRKAQNSNLLRAQEIERLRADNAGLSKAVISIQEERDLAQAEFRAYHKAWEEQAIEIERLRGFKIAARDLNNDLIRIAGERDELAARAQELEEALAEYQRLGKIMEGRLPCLTLHGECERCSSRAKELCDAMHQIAEGKIGPDAKQHCWQITDERKAALSRAWDALLWIDRIDSDNQTHIDVLRDMLDEHQ